jgi:DNA mismatch repair protein MutS
MERTLRRFIYKKMSPKDIVGFYDDIKHIQETYQLLQTNINSNDRDIDTLSTVTISTPRQTRQQRQIEYKQVHSFILQTMNTYGFSQVNEYCNELIQLIENTFQLEKASHIDEIQPDKWILGWSLDEICFMREDTHPSLYEKYVNSQNALNKLKAIQDCFSTIIQQIDKPDRTGAGSGSSGSIGGIGGVGFVRIHETPKQEPMLIGTKRRFQLLEKQLKQKIASGHKVLRIEYNVMNAYNDSSTPKKAMIELDITQIEFGCMGTNKKDMVVMNSAISTISRDIQNSREEFIQELHTLFSLFLQKMIEPILLLKMDKLVNYVRWIDVVQCRCYISKTYHYTKPIIDTSLSSTSYFKFKELRHPLIEHLQTNELYVTNDLTLGLKQTQSVMHPLGEDSKGMLLYGTNAVGKTSFIRSVGIAVIMAQSGLYVPASEFMYRPFTKIFTRILGNDNLFKGLSTFAVEMAELRYILSIADENSLVLGDELCSGTESESAKSIFMSGIEWLAKKQSTFIFATHFHEIQDYSELQELIASKQVVMKHMAVRYDASRDELIYDRKLKDGAGDSMYGLEVCRSLHLPSDFLLRANELRMKYNSKTTNILQGTTSHFNRSKIRGLCEMCKKEMGEEVHHLHPQQDVNKRTGRIHTSTSIHHKNHPANLVNVCRSCHDQFHNEHKQSFIPPDEEDQYHPSPLKKQTKKTNKTILHRRVKTTSGYIIEKE